METAIARPCPKCDKLSKEAHCENPEANCPWWKCLDCKIKFDRRGRFTPIGDKGAKK